MSHEEKKEDISWKLIDIYFKDNPNNLVAHHLDSYNLFVSRIKVIIPKKNPIVILKNKIDLSSESWCYSKGSNTAH